VSRLQWDELPPPLRARIEEVLGEPVVEARSQSGGFSPGSADRVITASGRRAFGTFLTSSLRPVPPRMPTLRTFQRDQAIVTLDWVRERWKG